MSNLYFYNYNTYYNRIVKKESSLEDYGTPEYSISSTNFYESDGVNAKHTLNISTNDDDYFQANYLIVCDNSNNIKSRWFVIESVHNRNRQYLLTLRRDLIVDYYDSVIYSPCLIEKALVNKDNPLIFNSEGFTFNQIKKNEILLQDNFRLNWIYLYIAKNTPSTTITVNAENNSVADYEVATSIENSIFGSTQTGRARNINFEIWIDNLYATFRNRSYTSNYTRYNSEFTGYIKFKSNEILGKAKNSVNSSLDLYDDDNRLDLGNFSWLVVDDRNAIFEYNSRLVEAIAESMEDYLTSTVYNNASANVVSQAGATLNISEEAIMNEMNGKIVKDTNGKFYQVNITKKKKSGTLEGNVNDSYAQTLNTALSSIITYAANNSTYEANYDYYEYETTYSERTDLSFNFNLDLANKTINKSECNIIAIPYGSIDIQTSAADPDTGVFSYDIANENKDTVLAIARAIAQTLTTSAVYDMQILPYSPYANYESKDSNGYLDIHEMATRQYLKTTYGGYSYYLFFLQDYNFTFDINETINIESYADDDTLDTKLSNECDMYRLCSPNYNSMFEFSVAKNNGVSKFNIDMTLKPYQPYIHINPDFKYLYGDDFNDTRGLVLSGDFSLPITGDQFANYELQNKNYQLIFDRQIQHMDIEHKLSRIEAGFSAATGTIAGGVGSGVAGGLKGGVGGAIAGASIGTVASGIGGALDYSFLKKRQNEEKDLKIDLFNYNLGNIKALPYSLSKVNPFSYNYKNFPFIEYYSCTDEEKDILLEKIKYNSMTVMAIGEINDYLQEDYSFIKGTLIRFTGDTNINDHEINEIYVELQKGVYIK